MQRENEREREYGRTNDWAHLMRNATKCALDGGFRVKSPGCVLVWRIGFTMKIRIILCSLHCIDLATCVMETGWREAPTTQYHYLRPQKDDIEIEKAWRWEDVGVWIHGKNYQRKILWACVCGLCHCVWMSAYSGCSVNVFVSNVLVYLEKAKSECRKFFVEKSEQ